MSMLLDALRKSEEQRRLGAQPDIHHQPGGGAADESGPLRQWVPSALIVVSALVMAWFGWQQFSDEEFALCPPLFAVGGDGAMMDIGFQNLSRLMASGKPLRVVVVDTQANSAGGGQACTAGFTGQTPEVFDAGPEQRHKDEVRKELALIAMAHRGVFVMQSSQATPSHLFENLLRGLQMRRPALFILTAFLFAKWKEDDED